MTEKADLRHTLKKHLAFLPLPEREAASQCICKRLWGVWTENSTFAARPVATFLPLSQEPKIDDFITRLAQNGIAVFAPYSGSDIPFSLSRFRGWENTTRNRFGVREPITSSAADSIALETIGLWLVPGLGFDVQGNRLGRGGGWYDRVLSRAAPDSLKIGVCFERQIVPHIPHERHDIRLDLVVTETRIIDARPSFPDVSTDS